MILFKSASFAFRASRLPLLNPMRMSEKLALMSKHTPSAVIVDNDKHPVGIANVVDLLLLPAGTVGIMTMRQVHLEKVILVEENRDVADALRILKENNVDILAIVDSKGKCTGSLSDREVLLGLGTVANEVPT